MKKTTLLLLTVTLLSLFLLKIKTQKKKKYTVSLTLNEWQSKLDLLNYVGAAIKQSDLPTKVSLPILDSLSKFTQTLVNQLNKQLIDTTKKK